MKKLSEEQFLDLCWALDKIGEAAWSGGGGQDTSALSEAMELIKQAYVDRPTSEEISKLTNELHALANEVAMHGWDYRPLLRANELLEKYAVAPEPKKWVVNVNKKRGYDDQDNPVEWNTCSLHPEPVSNFTPGTNEVIIEAETLGAALDKMIATYCSDDTEIEINAIAYFFKLENQ